MIRRGNCVACTKKKFSLFSELNGKELSCLDDNRSFITYKKGETILKTGMKVPGLICLSSGKAKIIKELTEGKELIIHLAKPVEFIGFREMLGEVPSCVTVVALEDCDICIIEKSNFMKVLNDNIDFAKRIIKHLATELVRQDNRLITLTQKYMRERLAEALTMLNEAYNGKDGYLSITLSREEIASIANMSRSNAIRTLYDFEKEKMVALKGKKIRILQPDKLTEVSSGSNGTY